MIDHKFNQSMSSMLQRGLRFADTPIQRTNHCSGLPHGYFKRTVMEIVRGWMGW